MGIAYARAFYLYVLDAALRIRLFRPPVHIQSLLAEIAAPEDVRHDEIVWIQAILRNPLHDPRSFLEATQNIDSASRDFAKRQLYPNKEDPPSEALLEKDILQIAVLEQILANKIPQQDFLVQRALLILVRGYGHILQRCRQGSWTLPPGFLRAAECAVRALNVHDTVTLDSLYLLKEEFGLLFSAQHPDAAMGVYAPEWLQVVKACNAQAARVQGSASLDPHLRDWLKQARDGDAS